MSLVISSFQNYWAVCFLLIGCGMVNRGWAQTFTTLHSFSGSDGANPQAGVILYGNSLFGTTYFGGIPGDGTVFSLNTDGTGFTNLHSFAGGSDGSSPTADLVLSGNSVYGTTWEAVLNTGEPGYGTVFKFNTDGTGYTNLHSFTGGSDGHAPNGGVVLSGNTMYGTTRAGGTWAQGTVFAVNTDGTGFTNLYNFTLAGGPRDTNADGFYPSGTLVLLGDALYGTTQAGGSWGYGTVFAVSTNGTGFRTLHSFAATASDGSGPNGVILGGNVLYGTTRGGGASGLGTLFRINTDGTGFTNLHSFPAFPKDGVIPFAGLILARNTLYGTTGSGPNSGSGTLFAINTDNTGFTNLYCFSATGTNAYGVLTNSDGNGPAGSLIVSGNTVYGTTSAGGASGYGTVFSLSLPAVSPQLTLVPYGGNAVLTWPTNAAGYTLQSTTNLGSPIWTTNLPAPFVANGQNVVTNPIPGTQQFFRLSQ